jgi:acyl-coenzyme A synthetase/AMP-(fatty) acid ligase
VGPLHDDLLGDAIGALIVLDATTSADELRRNIRPVLAAALRRSQWPHHIATASNSEIPRTSYGKIDRVALKKHLQERFGAAGSRLRKTTEL